MKIGIDFNGIFSLDHAETVKMIGLELTKRESDR